MRLPLLTSTLTGLWQPVVANQPIVLVAYFESTLELARRIADAVEAEALEQLPALFDESGVTFETAMRGFSDPFRPCVAAFFRA